MADRLLHLGLKPGDKVAYIGDGTGAYWAYAAGAIIVSEIPDGSASDRVIPQWISGLAVPTSRQGQ